METRAEVTTREENHPADDHAAANRSTRSGLLQLCGMVSLLVWALAILFCLYGWPDRRIEFTMFICYSLTTFAGFYLACGNARWWVRWLLVGMTILLILFANHGPGIPRRLRHDGLSATLRQWRSGDFVTEVVAA
ncbi:hypothetical protein Pan97_03710 [Bremerella volcania]|uniref:Uncharacterized protein n=1 Tax=Bremerella volcania TaxID=2527984 RepID=A0A518C2E5_9BACT|nr:hypothetical protein [Bremerella volcania]QDU73400.1 hypothetical protein Pan97_03710 [Bremerella volcania]